MASTEAEIDIPDELMDKLGNFHQAFEKMSEILEPLHTININSTDYKLDPLDRAHLNLSCGYALNSLFWMYLNTLGIDPKEHKVKSELERYKSFMLRIKEIADKDKAPVLDKGAAGRFLRNALWEPKESENAASSSKEPEVQKRKVRQERKDSSHKEKFDKNKKRRH